MDIPDDDSLPEPSRTLAFRHAVRDVFVISVRLADGPPDGGCFDAFVRFRPGGASFVAATRLIERRFFDEAKVLDQLRRTFGDGARFVAARPSWLIRLLRRTLRCEPLPESFAFATRDDQLTLESACRQPQAEEPRRIAAAEALLAAEIGRGNLDNALRLAREQIGRELTSLELRTVAAMAGIYRKGDSVRIALNVSELLGEPLDPWLMHRAATPPLP